MDSKWIVGGSLAMAATGFSLYGLYSWTRNPSIPANERNPTNREEIPKDAGGPDEPHDVDTTIVKSIFNCSSSEPSGGGVNLLENAEGTTSASEGHGASADKEKTEKTDSQTCAGTSIASSSTITHGREDHVLSLKVSASINTNNQADEGSVVTYSSAETQTFPMESSTVSETPDLLSSVGILNRPSNQDNESHSVRSFQRFDSNTLFDQISIDACPSLEESSLNENNSPNLPGVSGSHAIIPSNSTTGFHQYDTGSPGNSRDFRQEGCSSYQGASASASGSATRLSDVCGSHAVIPSNSTAGFCQYETVSSGNSRDFRQESSSSCQGASASGFAVNVSNDFNIPVTTRTEEVTDIEQRSFLGLCTRIPLEREEFNFIKKSACDQGYLPHDDADRIADLYDLLCYLKSRNLIQHGHYEIIVELLQTGGKDKAVVERHIEILTETVNDILNEEKGCDIVILHAQDDYRKAVEYKRHLESTLGEDANVLLFEEFNLSVQSEFRTIEGIFGKCRFVFVYVTNNLKEDELRLFQGEMCLTDSLLNEEKKWRVVPIWPEMDARKTSSAPLMLTVLRGLNYWQFNLGATEKDCPYVYSLKNLIKRGRQDILLRK